LGFGRGGGFGRGMAWRRGYNPGPAYYQPPVAPPAVTPADEKQYLSEERKYLEGEVETIKARLAEVDSTAKKK
jgi:hypothetical protein